MPKDILDYINHCIWHDYMMGVLITSASQGILPSIGMDYGVGKSTLAGQLDKGFKQLCLKCSEDEAYELAKKDFHRFPWELEKFIAETPVRYPGEPVFFIYDDMQETLGKDKSRDPYVRGLFNRATTRRRKFAVFIGTAPDIDTLALCWRKFFRWEIKVPDRGKYEVQFIGKRTRFNDPYETEAWMPKEDCAISDKYGFPDFPSQMKTWYEDWKEEMNKRADEGEGSWNLQGLKNVLTDNAKHLLLSIIEKGSYQRQTIITDMEQNQELKLLRGVGLVEQFGDTVVPTRQGRLMVKIL
jgi:hypothetical protein